MWPLVQRREEEVIVLNLCPQLAPTGSTIACTVVEGEASLLMRLGPPPPGALLCDGLAEEDWGWRTHTFLMLLLFIPLRRNFFNSV